MKSLILALAFFVSLPAFAEVVTVDSRTCDLQRDKYGRIARSKKAVSIFRKSVPCPGTGETGHACKGYVVDHVIPLCGCGADDPSNMQWQTLAESKIKDRWERKICNGQGD